MKKSLLSLTAAIALAVTSAQAIEPQELVDSYFENTGGKAAWSKLQGFKYIGEFDQGGVKFPFELVQLKDGRSYLKFEFQGKEIKQNVFDGETLWSVNFLTMKPEKADQETTDNAKLNTNDFPSDLFNYKEKGYTVEILGEETIDGTATHKVKLIKEPVTVDGKKVDDISYYYFDTEAMVPLVQHAEIKSGQGKGLTTEIKLSDYEEVDGLYFPFALSQGIKDQPGAGGTMTVKSIVLNPTIDASEFAFPAAEVTE